ncbi:hypothetical protein PU629_01275 [Pullulanibacillus sp. KACC 23026]|uniref:hypothetical protein n=1 Tax=Pullulanibacillus sp. KACC 23026 TaxID=3028315 RepID=UPI0023B09368|nr:hypothetical protein [Pullulanibacillus sp. KACC 23026]WEG13018.1 hypothetical protein PU629_01275 [Pullulanibacillus sp. KACC 23026]
MVAGERLRFPPIVGGAFDLLAFLGKLLGFLIDLLGFFFDLLRFCAHLLGFSSYRGGANVTFWHFWTSFLDF